MYEQWAVNQHVWKLIEILHLLPAYMKVVILLRSSGGAHFDSMAAIDGYVTACAYKYKQ